VIATKNHREGLAQRVNRGGVDTSKACEQGRSSRGMPLKRWQFVVDGWPDAARFEPLVGTFMAQAALPPETIASLAFG